VVVTSLPAMLPACMPADSYGSLIATGYAMFLRRLLMLGARLGPVRHRLTILVSLAVFAAGAAVAGAAPSILALTAGPLRAGGGGRSPVPSALRLLDHAHFRRASPAPAIAAWSAAGAAAGARASWWRDRHRPDQRRFIFWGYLPLSAALAAVIAASVPPDGAGGRRSR